MPGITYKKSGVDVERGNRFVQMIKPLVRRTHRPGVMNGLGGFGALYELPVKKYKKPLFVSSADGVGTKLKLALLTGKLECLGTDLVAMNVNDIVTCGAEPLFFLDYMAVNKLDIGMMKRVVQGMVKGCRQAGCALVGGETAEMPGLYRRGEFDLAGFAVGVVDASQRVDGSKVGLGDSVIGCASDGVHSNGFSLIRKIFSNSIIKENANDLLRPTKIYVKGVLSLLRLVSVHAMAHITGGGFSNIPRVLPKGKGVLIETGSWKIPRVFKRIQEKSKNSFKEMHNTFNMGVGFVLVVSSTDTLKTLKALSKQGIQAWKIGEIVKGKGVKFR